MSEAVVVALLVAIPPTLAALAALVVAIRTKTDLTEVKHQTNSLVQQLVSKAAEAGHGEGVAQERLGRRARTNGGEHQPPGP